jgi:crotonobetainyl-CoA:carnitine CoA-transferase CaiB-like acyl-CoA transferase
VQPVAGIKVLDLSRLLPGPLAWLVLAYLGAHVDKIEDAAGGDYLRVMPPHVGDTSSAFLALNRSKRSALWQNFKTEWFTTQRPLLAIEFGKFKKKQNLK